jgi:hypothetical protein
MHSWDVGRIFEKRVKHSATPFVLHASLVFSQHSTRALSHSKRMRLVFYFLNNCCVLSTSSKTLKQVDISTKSYRRKAWQCMLKQSDFYTAERETVKLSYFVLCGWNIIHDVLEITCMQKPSPCWQKISYNSPKNITFNYNIINFPTYIC